MLLKTNACGREWRKWFAWYPIETEDWKIVWLETVERKYYDCPIECVSPSSWIIYRRITTPFIGDE